MRIRAAVLVAPLSFVLLLCAGRAATAQEVKGHNVKKIVYTTNGQEAGSFVETAPKQWAEYKVNSTAVHATFTEEQRDEWSVYLRKSDGLRVQLDLWTKEVKFLNRAQYQISSSSDNAGSIAVPPGPMSGVTRHDVGHSACRWIDGEDASVPGDPGRGVSDRNAHYSAGMGAPRKVPNWIGSRIAALQSCLDPDRQARLYADVSVMIAKYGRENAGWVDVYDSRAPDDVGRGISDWADHYGWASNPTHLPAVRSLVESRMVALGTASAARLDSYANLFADLSVLMSGYGRGQVATAPPTASPNAGNPAAPSAFPSQDGDMQPGDDFANRDNPEAWIYAASKDWMSYLPDTTKLRDVSIPGTHDSGARFKGLAYEAQSWTITEQLDAGIRYLDIRCRPTGTAFAIHHGNGYMNAMFGDIMNEVVQFLQAHPKETVVMRVKANEHDPESGSEEASAIWARYRETYKNHLFPSYDADPTLGQVRGKVFVLRDNCVGCDLNGMYFNEEGKCELQDFYKVYWLAHKETKSNDWATLPSKKAKIKEYIDLAQHSNKWVLNHLSGAVGMTPPDVARATNGETRDYMASFSGKRKLGILIMDFPGERLIYRIIKSNFHLDSHDKFSSYDRGVGKPLHTCPSGDEKDGLLCYPRCKPGYNGVGPVCWQNCPSGYRDDGMFCAKPGPYGRGAGYPWKFGDKVGSLDKARARCARDNPQGCEKSGQIIYPKCKPLFHAVGCCICTPDCPSGMTDIGVSCSKGSDGRGVGKPMGCGPGEDEDAGLCYTPCRPGFRGIGPMCHPKD